MVRTFIVVYNDSTAHFIGIILITFALAEVWIRGGNVYRLSSSVRYNVRVDMIGTFLAANSTIYISLELTMYRSTSPEEEEAEFVRNLHTTASHMTSHDANLPVAALRSQLT